MSSEDTTAGSFREMAASIAGEDFASKLARQSALAASTKFDPPSDFERGVVPPGRYAQGQRSPIVWVLLCAGCAGFAPFSDEDYEGFLSGFCAGCGCRTRELHRFRAWIDSAAGCNCTGSHVRVVGDVAASERLSVPGSSGEVQGDV